MRYSSQLSGMCEYLATGNGGYLGTNNLHKAWLNLYQRNHDGRLHMIEPEVGLIIIVHNCKVAEYFPARPRQSIREYSDTS